jgi:hypothetical protein
MRAQLRAQEEFDLTVQRPKLVVRPALDSIQHFRIHAQQEGTSSRH